MIDSVLFRFLSRICDFIILNILWIVCSIPIVTIGASTTALYSVMLKMARNEEGYIVKGFLKGFTSNFKQSTIVWIFLLILSVLLFWDIRLTITMDIPFSFGIQTVSALVGLLLLFIFIYVFPMIARYENTTKNTVKNALLLSVVRLPYTFLLCIITVGPIILTFWTPGAFAVGIAVWSAIGVALLACINSILLRKAFAVLEQEKTNQEEL